MKKDWSHSKFDSHKTVNAPRLSNESAGRCVRGNRWRSVRRGDRDDLHRPIATADLACLVPQRLALQVGVLPEVPVDVQVKVGVVRISRVHVVGDDAHSETGDLNLGSKGDIARGCAEELALELALTDVALIGCFTRALVRLGLVARVAAHLEGQRLAGEFPSDHDRRRRRRFGDDRDNRLRFGDRGFRDRLEERCRSGVDRTCAARDVGFGCAAGERAEEKEAINSMIEHSCLRGVKVKLPKVA